MVSMVSRSNIDTDFCLLALESALTQSFPDSKDEMSIGDVLKVVQDQL